MGPGRRGMRPRRCGACSAACWSRLPAGLRPGQYLVCWACRPRGGNGGACTAARCRRNLRRGLHRQRRRGRPRPRSCSRCLGDGVVQCWLALLPAAGAKQHYGLATTLGGCRAKFGPGPLWIPCLGTNVRMSAQRYDEQAFLLQVRSSPCPTTMGPLRAASWSSSLFTSAWPSLKQSEDFVGGAPARDARIRARGRAPRATESRAHFTHVQPCDKPHSPRPYGLHD